MNYLLKCKFKVVDIPIYCNKILIIFKLFSLAENPRVFVLIFMFRGEHQNLFSEREINNGRLKFKIFPSKNHEEEFKTKV